MTTQQAAESGQIIAHGHAPAVAHPLTRRYDSSEDGCGRGLPIVGAIPRRLTPRECERLQGFPDDWTAVDGMKDGPRYRMMGNAVTVPVVTWIGRRIMEAETRSEAA